MIDKNYQILKSTKKWKIFSCIQFSLHVDVTKYNFLYFMNDLTLKYLHCIIHKTFSACIAVKKKKNDKSDKQFCEKKTIVLKYEML